MERRKLVSVFIILCGWIIDSTAPISLDRFGSNSVSDNDVNPPNPAGSVSQSQALTSSEHENTVDQSETGAAGADPVECIDRGSVPGGGRPVHLGKVPICNDTERTTNGQEGFKDITPAGYDFTNGDIKAMTDATYITSSSIHVNNTTPFTIPIPDTTFDTISMASTTSSFTTTSDMPLFPIPEFNETSSSIPPTTDTPPIIIGTILSSTIPRTDTTTSIITTASTALYPVTPVIASLSCNSDQQYFINPPQIILIYVDGNHYINCTQDDVEESAGSQCVEEVHFDSAIYDICDCGTSNRICKPFTNTDMGCNNATMSGKFRRPRSTKHKYLSITVLNVGYNRTYTCANMTKTTTTTTSTTSTATTTTATETETTATKPKPKPTKPHPDPPPIEIPGDENPKDSLSGGIISAIVLSIIACLVVMGFLVFQTTTILSRAKSYSKRPLGASFFQTAGAGSGSVCSGGGGGIANLAVSIDIEMFETKNYAEEFKCLPTPIKESVVITEEARAKNRNQLFLPIARTAVVLQRYKDDISKGYMNANFVKNHLREEQDSYQVVAAHKISGLLNIRGPLCPGAKRLNATQTVPIHQQGVKNHRCPEPLNCDCPRGFIATQAPMENTVEDFWRMIWEQGVATIVMLTNLEERGVSKCVEYWPLTVGGDIFRDYGEFEVQLVDDESFRTNPEWTVSHLDLRRRSQEPCIGLTDDSLVAQLPSKRRVAHFWLNWPSHSTEALPDVRTMNRFCDEVRRRMQQHSTSPTVVHCNTGTGRTGAFIVACQAMDEWDRYKSHDIPRIVTDVRNERAGTMPSLQLFTFVNEVLEEYKMRACSKRSSFDAVNNNLFAPRNNLRHSFKNTSN